jgi:hypothetical protein
MKPPFNMLRACFYLLCSIIILMMTTAIFGGISCIYMNFITAREMGACQFAANQIREIFTEMLTAVLALLLAARGPPNEPPEKPPEE